VSDALEDEEFYELMQTYRHWPIAHDSNGVVEAFEAVKAYVRRTMGLIAEETLDEQVNRFLSDYFGKQPNETLGQAIERNAMQESPVAAFWRKAKS
jgi:hypothetical protein